MKLTRIIWLSLLFISTSWLFLVPIFTPSNWKYGYSFLAMGIILSSIGFKDLKIESIDKKFLFLLLPLLFSAFFILYPYNIGLIFLIFGISSLFYPSMKGFSILNAISFGLLLTGTIFTIQALLLPTYSIIFSRYHEVNILSPVFSFFMNIFGLKTSIVRNIIFIQTNVNVIPFPVTFEKLGVYLLLNILVGSLIIFALSNKKERIAKNMVYLLILSSIYIIIRYIALVYIFLDTSRMNIFWDPLVLTISFLPFSLLLMKFYSIQLENSTLTEPFKVFKINKNRVGILLLTFLFIFFSVGIKGYHDLGIIKDGRILIDEVHSEWEPTTRPMDKEWYGEISTYNYYCLAEWLDHIYSVEKNIDKNIDTSLLSNYDILIIKCPTTPFSQEEINAIVKFVHEGGGLWLIGDHTNVFGMNTYLNSISRKFGINFNYDSTNDLNTGFLSTYTTPKVLKHPILKGISSFDFMTSCSLKAPLLVEDVMIGYSLGALPGDYSDKDFFRKIPLNSDMKFGSFLQSVAVKYGKGRVAAFTDSTCLSSFSIFMDGNPGFVLGNTEYLNRSNKYVHSNEIFLFLAILTLLVLVFSIRKEKKSIALCLILISGSFSSSLAILTFTYLDELNYPGISDPYPNLPTVSFENEHSDVLFGSVGRGSYIHNEKQFDTFFIWTQRVGYYPSIDILEDSLKKDIVVIINPGKNFTPKEIKDIVNYVKNGGKILLIDSAFNTDSTANDLLLNFGLAIKRGVDKLNIGEDFAIGEPSISIIGEEPILSLNEDVVVAKKKIGDGMIVVMVDSYTFSDSVMGGCFTVPDEFQRKVYELEYFIFENVLADKDDTIEGLYKIGDEK